MKNKIFKLSLLTTILISSAFVYVQQVQTNLMTKESQQKITSNEALEKLKAGNERFVSGNELKHNHKEEVAQTANGQYPYAVILSCIDSRVSSEIIFDQNLGDVFNARIAGNIVNTDILGSMEFACKVAGAKLIVVVGHTKCGAIKGACDHVELGNLTHLVNEIKPAVDSVKNISGERNSKNDAFVRAVALKNIELTIKEIRLKSPILKELEDNGKIKIVGALYDVSTGKVNFNLN